MSILCIGMSMMMLSSAVCVHADSITGPYDFKDARTSGFVEVIKSWVCGNADLPSLNLHISTQKPSKSTLGYTVTFNANGGKFKSGSEENSVIYSKLGNIVDGEVLSPVPSYEYGSLLGWYLDKEFTMEFKVSDNGGLTTELTQDITVYAKYKPYKPLLKYCVQIYGIGVDEDKNGNKLGVTFGPAMGDYINSSKSHTPSGSTESGNAHRCVHDDDWEDIVSNSKNDPSVYEECIVEGCTKAVSLDLSRTATLENKSFTPSYTGDGPGVLYYELMPTTSNYENLRWHPNGGEFGTNSGGWGSTRIRAMLNGADSLTDVGDINYSTIAKSDVNKSASIYTEENCLFNAFPEVLRNNIEGRKTKYDSVYNNKSEANLKVTYDKLWLLSPNEMGDSVNAANFNHPLEGVVYPKLVGTGDAFTKNTARVAYRVNSSSGGGGSRTSWFLLRSVSGGTSEDVVRWNLDGRCYVHGCYEAGGVAPCFSLR